MSGLKLVSIPSYMNTANYELLIISAPSAQRFEPLVTTALAVTIENAAYDMMDLLHLHAAIRDFRGAIVGGQAQGYGIRNS